MTKMLQQSFERMKTDYVDLYFLHGISSVKDIYAGTKEWAEKAKKDKKIRFFGFSTHRNMEDCLLDAAKLGWIDGIMMTYNYRVMDSDKMKQAVDACQKAGIGLTAMKTQGKSPGFDFLKAESETAKKLTDRLLQKGFTEHQA
ncbi:MAG: aldo/keto reductase, partial [Desulfobacteraceae bacterium]|nr:aldo/keto reductase [Desulfobacteraceae bacterium]